MVTSKQGADAARASAGPRKGRPEPRDREATRERILAAVGRVLARDGFSGLGVNSVAREAGVDKVLIYRYFGGIEGLLDAWGEGAVFGSAGRRRAAADAPSSPADRAAAALAAYARDLRAHPEALEVMRWELFEENVLTRRLAERREAAGLAGLRSLGVPRARAAAVDLPAAAALLSAGLLHVALRARTAPDWLGVPIRTEAGWARLERAAAALARALLEGPGAPRRPEVTP
ncbi:MAG TPA: helix-turn-helix domain-containing protein [Anaeromyxobacteraceae bacterium]|nr:helix-turn-helix domain-containing protein [Anaeromyxobacteraceae bacterium]